MILLRLPTVLKSKECTILPGFQSFFVCFVLFLTVIAESMYLQHSKLSRISPLYTEEQSDLTFRSRLCSYFKLKKVLYTVLQHEKNSVFKSFPHGSPWTLI